MVHNRKFQPQKFLIFCSYIRVFTVIQSMCSKDMYDIARFILTDDYTKDGGPKVV